MRLFKLSRVALLGRVFMASLFVGTLWMASAGCDHDDYDHDHDYHEYHHVDHDHDWR